MIDTKNQTILEAREAAFNARPGARVGDFVIMPNGKLHRFTHDWGDVIQTWRATEGSFYLADGYASYSGSLESSIPKSGLTLTDETRLGRFWFFNHDDPAANNGIDVQIQCRVFRYSGPWRESFDWHVTQLTPEQAKGRQGLPYTFLVTHRGTSVWACYTEPEFEDNLRRRGLVLAQSWGAWGSGVRSTWLKEAE
jgi:hypothetical protein